MARQRSAQPGSNRGMQSEEMSMQDQAPAEGMVEQAKGKAQELASEAQQKATQQVESGLGKGKARAADTLSGVAQSLHVSSEQLRERNQPGVSRYVDQAADRVERLSSYLQNTEVSELVDEIEDFARRQPALFLGGAFALGLVGARFFKSSRRRELERTAGRYSEPSDRTGWTPVRERDVTGLSAAPGTIPRQEWPTPPADRTPAGGVTFMPPARELEG